MHNILELVVIAVLVALVGEATFDLLKGKFSQLKTITKITLLMSGTVIAAFLALLGEKTREIHFEVPVPIPFFTSQRLTIVTQQPIVPAIIFGLVVTYFAALATWEQTENKRRHGEIDLRHRLWQLIYSACRGPPSHLLGGVWHVIYWAFREIYSNNYFVTFSLIALLYKIFLATNNNQQAVRGVGFILIAIGIGALFRIAATEATDTVWRRVGLTVPSVLFAIFFSLGCML
jgi:hypothetical protein